MSSERQLLDEFQRIFGQGPEYEIAQQLLSFLARNADTTYINLQLVRQLTPGGHAGDRDSAIVRTLQFLCGDAVHVLEVGFELFDDEEHAHKLSKDEVRVALEANVNPLTGERDPDIRRRVAMYFAPTVEVMTFLADKSSPPGAQA